ncbi:MAG: HAD-IA family hydrolase [Campylobacterota bacterium]|nr:HAD-IA family hydrolase [Campylobacterota bacterium]
MVKSILWDFDGVILDSMPIRDYGFRKIFESYPKDLVEQLIEYHQLNGGLSRFHKIKYFYNELLNQEIDEAKIAEYASSFSEVMRAELPKPQYLIDESVEFIKSNHQDYIFHIVSGSEQNELRYLCQTLGIAQYFKSINGSPIHKNDLVKNVLATQSFTLDEYLLIGDSINDYEAAKVNGIKFYGYNNEALKEQGEYIDSFDNFYS